MVGIQKRVVEFVTRANWFLFALTGVLALINLPIDFALGVISGGLIVTVNFHLLSRTLKKSLSPKHLSSHSSILAKYYIRFIISGLIIFVLISNHIVHPLGLLTGLSVVVVSIVLATMCELTKHLFGEAL